MSCAEYLSLILSVLALLLSLTTFWYVSIRKGKITVENPISFKTMGSPHEKERIPIRLPIVITNSGAKTVILTNLFLYDIDNSICFNYSSILDELSIFDEEKRNPPKPIILPPYTSTLINIEFQSPEIIYEFSEKPNRFLLKTKIKNRQKEVLIGNITLQTPMDLVQQINSEMRMVENVAYNKKEL